MLWAKAWGKTPRSESTTKEVTNIILSPIDQVCGRGEIGDESDAPAAHQAHQ